MVKGGGRGIDADQRLQDGAPEHWIWTRPEAPPAATLLLAHGAGAPMDSPFMESMARRLAGRGVAVVRFEFPYMAARRQDGVRRLPNPQAQLLDSWRWTYALVRQQVTGVLAVGGKSMGGRMASMLADEIGADALVCLGYPFHAPGKQGKPRVEHLKSLQTPTLIVQGERDRMGTAPEVEGYTLASSIEVLWLEAADHDLKPTKASGFTHDGYLDRAAEAIARLLGHIAKTSAD
ncbi:alpha/beta family hydrolase [Pseudomonas sp.]|uniref:alpha/beta family hydrolase n=1 Tax=Pseudomonas sp. TaxID=306 RepID=UPI0028AA218B|nr:alpha/beta family hydrolase [Pseudomonas sp.]